MSLWLETCRKCERAYMLEEFSPGLGDEGAVGVIRCPYCHDERPGDPDAMYLGHRLPANSPF